MGGDKLPSIDQWQVNQDVVSLHSAARSEQIMNSEVIAAV